MHLKLEGRLQVEPAPCQEVGNGVVSSVNVLNPVVVDGVVDA